MISHPMKSLDILLRAAKGKDRLNVSHCSREVCCWVSVLSTLE